MYTDSLTFKPSYWRCFFTFLIPYLMGSLTGIAFAQFRSSTFSLSSWLFVGLAMAVGGAIAALVTNSGMQERLTITVAHDDIAGPAPWGWSRVTFPVAMVDGPKTCRQTTVQKSLGYRYIWSTDGKKIVVHHFAFDTHQTETLLATLGCTSKN